VDPGAQVLEAARSRAAALAAGDAVGLEELLHVDFRWTSHTGESFDRATYISANVGGDTTWRHQDLGDPEVLVVGDAAVLRTLVTDTVNGIDGAETFRMPMTQFWIRSGLRWQCLAGHAGPRLRP
jgi:ketosteroid isomerase-like protein